MKITSAKEKAWKSFIDKDRPWGKPYKIMVKARSQTSAPDRVKKADGTLTSSKKETEEVILAAKFPRAPGNEIEDPTIEEEEEEEEERINYVTKEELKEIIRRLNNKSSPGIDGINHKTLKTVNIMHPDPLCRLFNECIRWKVFPEIWKTGKLILAQKPTGETTNPDTYRPLTMLPTLGKVLERCMSVRINASIEGKI